jgi:hypothetical protein
LPVPGHCLPVDEHAIEKPPTKWTAESHTPDR